MSENFDWIETSLAQAVKNGQEKLMKACNTVVTSRKRAGAVQEEIAGWYHREPASITQPETELKNAEGDASDMAEKIRRLYVNIECKLASASTKRASKLKQRVLKLKLAFTLREG